MPRYRVTITSKDREAMLDLVRKHKIQVFDHGSGSTETGEYTAGATVQPAEVKRLRSAGYRVEQHEDVDEYGKERQREVGKGDRYKRPDYR